MQNSARTGPQGAVPEPSPARGDEWSTATAAGLPPGPRLLRHRGPATAAAAAGGQHQPRDGVDVGRRAAKQQQSAAAAAASRLEVPIQQGSCQNLAQV